MTRLRQLWLLTALGSVVVLAGGYFLLVSPQTTKAAALREETETQLQVNKQLQSQINMLNKQKKDLPAQQAKLAKFAGLIPSNPAMPALLRALNDAADNAGVELLAVTPTLPTWAKGVNPATGVETPGRVNAPNGTVLVDVPVALHVAGHYSNLTSFFAEIEDLNRALLVSDFKVERPDGKVRKHVTVPDPNLLTATIGAHVMMTTKAATPPAPTAATSTNSDVTK